MISRADLLQLANLIKEEIEAEFEYLHLTHNLVDTMKIIPSENGYYIDIPADMYDINAWYEKGLILYTGEGSYAQEVNISGGFSTKHKGFIEDCIKSAIQDFIRIKKLKVKEYEEI